MENNLSRSLEIARPLLGKAVELAIDRPLGSQHPKHGFVYEVNYGYVPGVMAPDGEDLDAYFLGVEKPLEKVQGIVVAIIHRLNDDDDKLVVVPEGVSLSDEEIEKAVAFQERFFKHVLIRPWRVMAQPTVGSEYVHYKGKRYRVIALARHSETLEEMVVYEALYDDHQVWVRPLAMFMSAVEVDGKRMSRFKQVDSSNCVT